MQAQPPSRHQVDLKDLGFGRVALFFAIVSMGFAPAALGLWFGVPAVPTVGIAGGGLMAAATTMFFANRRLRRAIVDPLYELMTAMDQLRSSGQAPRISEIGAPLLQPMMRRFNLTGVALEQRGRHSLATLMSVEAAFDRVHAVLQSLREGVVVIDPSGRVVLVNRNARRLLQTDDKQIEGTPLIDLVEGPFRAALIDGTKRVDAGKVGEIHAADVPHGGRIFDLTIVQVQSNRPDQDFGKVVVFADVTRNHELNKLKDDLLSSISHELRTPLTNMCSSSEILTTLTAADESEWREFATMLNSESRRLKSLVDDVMEYSLLETRRTVWAIERTNVSELVKSAVAVVRPAAERKSVALECRADIDAVAEVDPQRIIEVMCRLLDNAVKFTPENGRVQASVTVHDGLIEIAVADSGPGVPADARLKVFERFSQMGDVMTDKPQGTGLGLSIAQRIVDSMGGTIWCDESQLGGAVFRFVLPLIEQTTPS